MSDPRLTKAARREATRAKAARSREEQQRKARRTRMLALAGLVAAVVVLVVAVGLTLRDSAATREAFADVAYGAGEHDVRRPALGEVPTPSVSDDTGGVRLTAAGVGAGDEAPVEVEVYLDFMCPFCGQFEAANGPMLSEKVAAGEIALTYRVVSILDSQSAGSSYSTRAAHAAAVVADAAPDSYADFVAALFADQPEEGTTGLTDERIADIASANGVPNDVTEQFTATVTGTYSTLEGDQREGAWRTFAPWVSAVTGQAATDLGELRTPTVLIDGAPYTGDLVSSGPLEQALVRAAS